MEQQMKMIRHQCPGETGKIPSLQVPPQPLEKYKTVLVIHENVSFFDSTAVYMMIRARKINAGCSGHERSRFNHHAKAPASMRTSIISLEMTDRILSDGGTSQERPG